jgi:hypothetical protein
VDANRATDGASPLGDATQVDGPSPVELPEIEEPAVTREEGLLPRAEVHRPSVNGIVDIRPTAKTRRPISAFGIRSLLNELAPLVIRNGNQSAGIDKTIYFGFHALYEQLINNLALDFYGSPKLNI